MGIAVVAFDLDLTLLDTRPGIRASLRELSAATGVPIDDDAVVARLGPKLEVELAHWFPAGDVNAAADQYRAIYARQCVGAGTRLMPGAAESVGAARTRGARVIAVTAKSEPLSWKCLDTVGLALDAVAGSVHGDEKRAALVEHDADVYVGDTIADVVAGCAAGVTTAGVATGMHSRDELAAAGAHAVFESLESFPAWFAALT